MRKAVVSGQFYPSNKTKLWEMVSRFVSAADEDLSEVDRIYGGVVPHAGYIYSGQTAARTYLALKKKRDIETFVIFGPNHTGLGSPVAVSSEEWQTPIGVVEPDLEIIDRIPPTIIDRDELAHRREHSIEVQLPFLQYLFEEFKIVPICLGLQDQETIDEVVKSVLEAISNLKREMAFIASSDFSHYIPEETAHRKDRKMIEKIEEMDVSGMYRVLYKENISACGYGGIASVMEICKEMGAKEGRLLRYTTSAETSGDSSQVVGYASIIMC
ncbi:MAG: hypothetical protein MASP_00653 [Candidatus Methanolliviera sp. GoM_asphalt]|nr:MAG: hypothetical protein MASP_00653 [Candidatus Methanolliviera sp. GoM_asphalt]